ncbi:unnamed protein product, partial [Nippostrongylus brasiliensis]|uniref:DUF5641 domain-containing protein n=1 Tax=Nippostrongylus brasiliensis TaxID=27835 RepID=A0A0N4YNL7_NIPBR
MVAKPVILPAYVASINDARQLYDSSPSIYGLNNDVRQLNDLNDAGIRLRGCQSWLTRTRTSLEETLTKWTKPPGAVVHEIDLKRLQTAQREIEMKVEYLEKAIANYTTTAEELKLLISKTKLPSIKTKLTIPKLEMNALTMAARLVSATLRALRSQLCISSITIYSDSEIALAWLASSDISNKAGVLLKNRCTEIRTITEDIMKEGITVTFGHVNTNLNPADCATRGLSKEDLAVHLWWNGLLMDPNIPRNTWKMARITQVHPNKDNVIREVELMLPNRRKTRRPINLIVPLELDDCTEDQTDLQHQTEEPNDTRQTSTTRYNLRKRPHTNYNMLLRSTFLTVVHAIALIGIANGDTMSPPICLHDSCCTTNASYAQSPPLRAPLSCYPRDFLETSDVSTIHTNYPRPVIQSSRTLLSYASTHQETHKGPPDDKSYPPLFDNRREAERPHLQAPQPNIMFNVFKWMTIAADIKWFKRQQD